MRQGGEQARRVRHATPKKRNTQIRKGRKGRQSKEPRTGNRHWAFRSAKERREGSAKEIFQKKIVEIASQKNPGKGRGFRDQASALRSCRAGNDYLPGRRGHAAHWLLGYRNCLQRIPVELILRLHERVTRRIRLECTRRNFLVLRHKPHLISLSRFWWRHRVH